MLMIEHRSTKSYILEGLWITATLLTTKKLIYIRIKNKINKTKIYKFVLIL